MVGGGWWWLVVVGVGWWCQLIITPFDFQLQACRQGTNMFMITTSTSESSLSGCKKSEMKVPTESAVMCPNSTTCLHEYA